ncbi:MFS transporter [Streptomyces sp. NPDC054854]
MSASLSFSSTATPSAVPKNVHWVLLGVMLAMLLSMLDNMVVSSAMPAIVRDPGGPEHISWVVTDYTLVTAVTTSIWGRCGDLLGRKPMYLASIACSSPGPRCGGRPSPWPSRPPSASCRAPAASAPAPSP